MSIPNRLRAAGAGTAEIIGLAQNTQTVGNSPATLTDLRSDTIQPGTLANDGDSITFEYFGSFTGDASSQVKLLFGSAVVFDTDVIDPGATGWTAFGRITRTSAGTQKLNSWMGGLGVGAFVAGDATEDLTGAVDLVLKGKGTNASDTICTSSFLSYCAVPNNIPG